MSQIGRIGGQALTDNLLRAGVDLAFETDLLYLKVGPVTAPSAVLLPETPPHTHAFEDGDPNYGKPLSTSLPLSGIGINNDVPVYDLDVNSNIISPELTITNNARIDDITFTAPDTFGSVLSPIEIFINGDFLFHDRLTTSSLEFDDNFIGSFSNSNIVLDPNGSGTVEIQSTTNITGKLDVDGNISLPGNLRTDGNITFGDSTIDNSDTVTIAPDLTQSLIPGDNILYDLGTSLKRWKTGYTNNVDIFSGFTAGNITIASPSAISVPSGNISINILGANPIANFTGNLKNSQLLFDGNTIQSFNNQNIRFNPNGTGPINLEATSNVTGNLGISGNTVLSGDLKLDGAITIGNQTIDTITINTDLTQSIIPGDDLAYALGADAGDSSPRRWAQIYATDWTGISTGAWPGSGIFSQVATVSDQMFLDGINKKISTIQSNEDIILSSDAGAVYIEKTKWQDNYLTNLLNTPLTFVSTGRGYLTFNGTNGMVIPFGTDAERRPTPEIGETRWNTDQQYLECWDGTAWTISIGAGPTVTLSNMEDYSNIWSLILG